MSGSNPLGGGAASPPANVLQPTASPPTAAHPLAQHLPTLDQSHNQAIAAFAATGKAMTSLDQVRDQLINLVKLGDTIQPEDVVHAAGKLVGQGQEPMALAGILADMPDQGGEALANWVEGHAQAVLVQGAKVAQAHAAARHQLGVAGMTSLMAHSLAPGSAGPALAPAGGNPLNPAPTSLALSPTSPTAGSA